MDHVKPRRPPGNAARAPLPLWRRLAMALLLLLGAMASAHAQIGGGHGHRQNNQQQTPQRSPAPTAPFLPEIWPRLEEGALICKARGDLVRYQLRAVFRLALRQTEGLIGSVIRLLGLDLAIPDHSTLSRRAETLAGAGPPSNAEPVHLLVDSTGLKLSGAGEWSIEKHGTSRRRSWRKLHIGLDGESGEIVAIELTKKESDDAARIAALLDQLTGFLASFTADGAYDQDRVYETVA